MPCYTTHNYTRKDINIPTETITIRVDARAVQAFKSAPEAQRQKLEQLLSLRCSKLRKQMSHWKA